MFVFTLTKGFSVSEQVVMFGPTIGIYDGTIFQQTSQALSTTGYRACASLKTGAAQAKAYAFGGTIDSNLSADIDKFELNTVSHMSAALAQACDEAGASALNGLIYIFGGQLPTINSQGNTSSRISSFNESTVSWLSGLLFIDNPYAGSSDGAASFGIATLGSKINTFGGYNGVPNGGGITSITEFDGSQITTLGSTLADSACMYVGACAVGANAYIFGGFTKFLGESGGYTRKNTIQKWTGSAISTESSTIAAGGNTWQPTFAAPLSGSAKLFKNYGLSSIIQSYDGVSVTTDSANTNNFGIGGVCNISK